MVKMGDSWSGNIPWPSMVVLYAGFSDEIKFINFAKDDSLPITDDDSDNNRSWNVKLVYNINKSNTSVFHYTSKLFKKNTTKKQIESYDRQHKLKDQNFRNHKLTDMFFETVREINKSLRDRDKSCIVVCKTQDNTNINTCTIPVSVENSVFFELNKDENNLRYAFIPEEDQNIKALAVLACAPNDNEVIVKIKDEISKITDNNSDRMQLYNEKKRNSLKMLKTLSENQSEASEYIQKHVVNMLVLCPDTVVLMEKLFCDCETLFLDFEIDPINRLEYAKQFVEFSADMGKHMVSLGIVFPDWKLHNICCRDNNGVNQFCLIDTEDMLLYNVNHDYLIRTYRPTGWELDYCDQKYKEKGVVHASDAFVVMITMISALLSYKGKRPVTYNHFIFSNIKEQIPQNNYNHTNFIGSPYELKVWKDNIKIDVKNIVDYYFWEKKKKKPKTEIYNKIINNITSEIEIMMNSWVNMFSILDLSKIYIKGFDLYKYVCDEVDEFYKIMRNSGMNIYTNLISILEGSVNFVKIGNIQDGSNA